MLYENRNAKERKKLVTVEICLQVTIQAWCCNNAKREKRTMKLKGKEREYLWHLHRVKWRENKNKKTMWEGNE